MGDISTWSRWQIIEAVAVYGAVMCFAVVIAWILCSLAANERDY